MRLIATIGANRLNHTHTYNINHKSYKQKVSFLALAKAFDIKDIVLIGTKESEESIKELLNDNIKMVIVDSSDVSEVFQKSLEYISKDTILDLTQGYRHYPMLTLLASTFLQNRENKNIKDIFYAQIVSNECKPYLESCTYDFISLSYYLDIANMAKIIDTFKNTLIVPEYDVIDRDFNILKRNLRRLSKAIFSNNFNKSKLIVNETIESLKIVTDTKKLTFLDEHLKILENELKTIKDLASSKESLTLLNVSEYFLNKDIFLHSVTFLYESMVAFLDEKLSIEKCNSYKDTYRRRNCLKKSLKNCKYIELFKCKDFSKILKKVDILRNSSAHAFTSSNSNKDLESEITAHIKNLRKIMVF